MTWEQRITFEASTAAPDDPEVWVDLTTYIRDVEQTIELGIGRQTNLDQTDPSTVALLLDNNSDLFTVGNVSSAYASWWGIGAKCRLREQIGMFTQTLITGYITQITETVITEDAAGRYQRVLITIGDWLARLEKAPAFVSTLNAHIIGSDRGGLTALYPLNDAPSPSFAPPPSKTVAVPTPVGTVARSPLEVISGYIYAGGSPEDLQIPTITWQGADGPDGDDARFVNISPSDLHGGYLNLQGPISLTLSGTDQITVVIWVYIRAGGYGTVFNFINSGDAPPFYVNSRFTLDDGGVGAALRGVCSTTAGNLTLNGPVLPTYRWTQIALQMSLSPNSAALWVDGVVVDSGALSGVTASQSWDQAISVGANFDGALAYLQVYLGAPGLFTTADALAQVAVGTTALERQTTGARINSILDYVGVPAGQRRIDTGTSVMQRATLAGVNPLDALRGAEETEQGLLYVDGSGNVTFFDRRRLYNI